jgi:phosphoribosylformylglycinamidine cyclo-ligase
MVVAKMAGDFSSVGGDLVNHCVNDVLCQGGRPLFFLDYVGTSVLAPDVLAALVKGMAAACKENGCALLGGETAEMPGFYQEGDYEVVGFIVGLAAADQIPDRRKVNVGDLLIGLPSAGLHTNGYSLARRVLFEQAGLGLDDRLPGTKTSVRRALLAPHLSYLRSVDRILGHRDLHGLAHITGGGLTDNLPRVLPESMSALIRAGSWEIPETFRILQELGGIDDGEMFRVFNMGIGMVAIVGQEGLAEILALLKRARQRAYVIGTVQKGRHGVVYDLLSEPLPDGAENAKQGSE